jgi:hypothetical protein
LSFRKESSQCTVNAAEDAFLYEAQAWQQDWRWGALDLAAAKISRKKEQVKKLHRK